MLAENGMEASQNGSEKVGVGWEGVGVEQGRGTAADVQAHDGLAQERVGWIQEVLKTFGRIMSDAQVPASRVRDGPFYELENPGAGQEGSRGR